MVAPIPDDKKREAIRLRVEERLSLDAIAARTGIAKSTLSALLKEYALSEKEVHDKKMHGTIASHQQRKYQPVRSKIAHLVSGKQLSTAHKGRAAESAVRLRLELLAYDVYTTSENSDTDFVVGRSGSQEYVRLQVKWARREDDGRPYVNLRNGEGNKIRRVSNARCDFVIGYDLETDTAFVIPIAACDGMNSKSCDEEYAEAWHLLGI